jgi:hypothetical protein
VGKLLNVFRYQPDDYFIEVETCSLVNNCYVKFCCDGLSVYLLFIIQHNGMHNFKIVTFIHV